VHIDQCDVDHNLLYLVAESLQNTCLPTGATGNRELVCLAKPLWSHSQGSVVTFESRSLGRVHAWRQCPLSRNS
jgi:hypothetical protein